MSSNRLNPDETAGGTPASKRPPEEQITQMRVGSVWIEVDAEGRPIQGRGGGQPGRGLWRTLLDALRRGSRRGR